MDYDKEELRRMIILKDIVAEAIWYLLSGGLITSISSNYIILNGCNRSAEEMKEHHDEYEKNQKVIHEASNKIEKEKRVYYTKD